MTAFAGTTKGSWCGANSTAVRQRAVGSGQTTGRRAALFRLCAAAGPDDERHAAAVTSRTAQTIFALGMCASGSAKRDGRRELNLAGRRALAQVFLAERVGFQPTVRFPVHRI